MNSGLTMASNGGLVVRKANSFDDLKFLSELLEKEVEWILGQNELRCAFSCDPSGFFVGELGGKTISYISVVKFDHFAFVSYFVVEESYRGKGYGRQTWEAGLASVDKDCNVGLASVPNMVGFYEKKGFRQAWVNREYAVSASTAAQVLAEPVQLPSGTTIKPITEVTFDALVAYDTAVFGAPRHKYLETLTKLSENIAFAAVNDKGLLGYISSEKMLKGVRIGPLFADNEQVAQGLLQAVSKAVVSRNPHTDTKMTLVVPDINPVAINLVERVLFGESDFQPVHMFSKGIPASMNLPKIFGITSLDIG